MTEFPSCALDADGLARQRERYIRLGPAVVAMRRDGPQLTIHFGPDYDRHALDELIAVERECCPFFNLWFDERARRLAIGVNDFAHADALDALEDQLRPAQSPR